MKERLIYDTLIIDQSFLYGGNYEKGSYYCIYNVFIRDDFFIRKYRCFFEPVEVFNKAIVVAILIIAFIICCLYRKNKKRR